MKDLHLYILHTTHTTCQYNTIHRGLDLLRTHVNFRVHNVDEASQYNDEVEHVPRVSEIVLHAISNTNTRRASEEIGTACELVWKVWKRGMCVSLEGMDGYVACELVVRQETWHVCQFGRQGYVARELVVRQGNVACALVWKVGKRGMCVSWKEREACALVGRKGRPVCQFEGIKTWHVSQLEGRETWHVCQLEGTETWHVCQLEGREHSAILEGLDKHFILYICKHEKGNCRRW